jgi:hypothetical protein
MFKKLSESLAFIIVALIALVPFLPVRASQRARLT